MLDRSEVGKRGYLHENFRLFRLKDSRAQKMEYHYHEFDKIILLLSGKVTYVVEGKSYFLQPWDILLVQHHMIHQPVIDPAEPYERIIIWLNSDSLSRYGEHELDKCFQLARERNFHLLRADKENRGRYRRLLERLEAAMKTEGFGKELLADTYFLQLLIAINRDILKDHTEENTESYRFDPKIEAVIRYIGEHLQSDLSVEALSGEFYLSRYYLMHRFKEVTGYTVHQYVTQKRLQKATRLIREGVPVMKAAEQSGFREYSTFLRSFQAAYRVSPKEFKG